MSEEAREVSINSGEDPLNPERVLAQDHLRLARHIVRRTRRQIEQKALRALRRRATGRRIGP